MTPADVHPVLMIEGDATYQPDEAIGEPGFSVRRLFVGVRADPTAKVTALGVVDFAGEAPRILDASLTWRPLPAVELAVGQAKTPLFPSARDQGIDTTPLPELSTVVHAFWPGRDPGVEVHLAGASLPVEAWLRVGDGSESARGNDDRALAGDARLDLVVGRERRGVDRGVTGGLRVGGGVHLGDVADGTAISGVTVTGFSFWTPPPISGSRALGEGHVVVDVGPVRVTVEGAAASESREGSLAPIGSRGVAGEVAWMTTGEHRQPGAWPVSAADPPGSPGVELSARAERLWTGLGATDVRPGGAAGGEVGARIWWPFGVALGVVGQALAFDDAPADTPGDRFAWAALARSTFRFR